MYSSLQLGFKYLNYYISASNGRGHGIHSPFVFEFVAKILKDQTHYPEYERIEEMRRNLLKNKKILQIEDLGAGTSSSKSEHRSISGIARSAVKPRKYGQLLFRLAKYYKPGKIIELGTSLGITTSYLSLAAPGSDIISLEGAPALVKEARNNFKNLGLTNIRLVEGNFDYILPAVLYDLSTVDLAFIDGNHRFEPTLNYFHWLLEKSKDHSIIVFDDIHWSKEMEQAWESVKQHPSVRCSIDLFFIGIVFFRQGFRERQHFTIRF